MDEQLIKGAQLRENGALRQSFFALAEQIFGLSFEEWHRRGFWEETYLPYALADGAKIVANVSATIVDLSLAGSARRYLQLGTVMTDPSYRGRGLCRFLIQQVLCDWSKRCDSIYLYANDSVLNFYPRFGFFRESEYAHTLRVRPLPGDFLRIDPLSREGTQLMRRCYQKGNPFSLCSAPNLFGLLMFYCGSFLRECVFYSPRRDALCIAKPQGKELLCYDIFCGPEQNLLQILGEMATPGRSQFTLGFTPLPAAGQLNTTAREEALFVLKGMENPFRSQKMQLPLLSHA